MTHATHATAADRAVGSGTLRFEHVRRRIAVVGALGLDGLAVPDRVTLLADESVRVVEPQPQGITLRAWRESAGPLSAGECVWWAVEVAALLTQLHKAGLAHGALTDDAIWVTGGGVRITHLADGPDHAVPADDVAALGSLMIAAVSAAERARVEAWTAPMTSANPAARPTAAMVSRALPSCADPRPWGEPSTSPGQHVASDARRGAALSGAEPLAEAEAWRRRRARLAVALRVGSGIAVLAILAVVVAAIVWWTDSLPAAAVAGHRAADSLEVRAGQGGVDATRGRLAAIATSSPVGLVEFTGDGTAARLDAESVALLIETGRFSVEGLTFRVESVSVVDAPHRPAVAGDTAVARVTYWTSAYTSILDGESARIPEARETAELTMSWSATGSWLVSEARVVG